MRRTWIIAGLFITATSAAAYQLGSHLQEYHYVGSRLKVDLAHPDALIRTQSLSRLPHDLLEIPIARDVLTEKLAFYYEQGEDRLGLKGAIRRIAYEHDLHWTDRILTHALNEPAEVAFWRDGKGALRNYALVMRRNALAKVLQEAASVALNDGQLSRAGEIDTGHGKAMVLALALNPRRTFLLISLGERIVVLSDPGLLFDGQNNVVPAARDAVIQWLNDDQALSRQFALDEATPQSATGPLASPAKAIHTLAIGARTLTLGYDAFFGAFRGVRFDYNGSWSTSVRIDPQKVPAAGLGEAALWRAAPANPAVCALLPVDWTGVRKLLNEADKRPQLSGAAGLNAFGGPALACWYGESNLYSPLFITHLTHSLPLREQDLQTLANWAIHGAGSQSSGGRGKSDVMLWKAAKGKAEIATRDGYVVFSPDGALVDKTLDTIGRTNPSVADQMPTSSATLALMTPRPLSAMAEKEMLDALKGPDDADLLAVAQAQLPARIQALAAYPPYRLELGGTGPFQGQWQQVQWRTLEMAK